MIATIGVDPSLVSANTSNGKGASSRCPRTEELDTRSSPNEPSSPRLGKGDIGEGRWVGPVAQPLYRSMMTKQIKEQIELLWAHAQGSEIDLEFIELHAAHLSQLAGFLKLAEPDLAPTRPVA